MNYKRYKARKALPKRSALAVALAVGMGISGLAFAQATSGSIFGTAPAGDTVRVSNGVGFTRTVSVGQGGSYTIANLPLGTYTVTLLDDGQTVSTRNNVSVQVGAGVAVTFASAQNAQALGGVQVTANALPAIDVTSVHDTSIITAAQLQKLPLGRSAESIALLTPGTAAGSSYFSGPNGNSLVTFGGASGAENAYYVNGYNTGNLYTNEGGYQLPYGAIAQQQTLAGGFSAKYGRSDGGVISQTGKRGTNEWHFGVQAVWAPEALMASPKSNYYPYVPLPDKTFAPLEDSDGNPIPGTGKFKHDANYTPGKIRSYNGHDKYWTTTYTAYVGGPLIKDKLFIFLDASVQRRSGQTVGTNTVPTINFYSDHHTQFYGKVDWNINDSNIFELTGLQRKGKDNVGATYNYSYDTYSPTDFRVANDQDTIDAKFIIAHYTSYISDNATLSILYGHGSIDNPVNYAYQGGLPYVSGGPSQDPAVWAALEAANPGLNIDPNQGLTNAQPNTTIISPDSHLSSHGLRVDFTYILGDHTLGVGIDNMYYTAEAQGVKHTGGPPPGAVKPNPTHGGVLDGTRWAYGLTNSGQYYVEYLNYENQAGMSTTQKAWYVQDIWRVTSNLQLNLGVRNDHYINYNSSGHAFVNEKNQWEPRLGFSWDVFGDSSFKIYGNAGRYYLALPLNAANRAANPSVYEYQDFTYTSIDPDTGIPQGLEPFQGSNYIVSPDGEFGGEKDPKQVTATNLKPMYVDKYNLGFDKKLGENWVYGAKLSYSDLKATIDDECMPGKIDQKLVKMGMDPADFSKSVHGPAACRLINPGKTSNLLIKRNDNGSYFTVPMSFADWGYPQKPKRTFKQVNVYFSHPFDGKWFARADLTWASAKGNTSGQIRPDFGQADVSKTEDWDSAELMVGQDGELLNSHDWIFRLRGAYQITPEWLVSATARVKSGTANECLGYFGQDALGDPTGYNRGNGGNYHWCWGRIVHPGSDDPLAGHTPWTHILNLGVSYTPAFADHKLAFKLFVFNALNEQKVTQTVASYPAHTHVASNLYHYPVAREPARYVRLSVSYDY